MSWLSRVVSRAVGGGLLLVAISTASLPAAAQDKISEEAKLYFKNGVELIQATPPNYQDAYYQFKLAYEKSRSWKVLGNLGLCALKLERDGEALDAYTEYLKSGGKDVDPEERTALERDTLLISGNSAVLNLTSAAPDADVIDTRAGSSVPPQTYKFQNGALALRLRAGTHTLTATASDGRQEKWEVVLTPGKSVDHRFAFAPQAAPTAAPVAPVASAVQPTSLPPPVNDTEGKFPLRTVGFVTAGVGAAALVGGVVTGLLARSAESDAKDACNGKICPTSAESDFDSASSLATMSNVFFIGGGVLAAAGVGMIVFGGDSGAEAPRAAAVPRLRLTPVVTAREAGLFATGRF
jgi:hypothetical protein